MKFELFADVVPKTAENFRYDKSDVDNISFFINDLHIVIE